MMSSIFHRISVRKFEDRPIEKEKIVQVLKAGMQAPSACNQQPWEFYVVTDKEKIQELSTATPYSKCAAGAPVVIVPVYRTEGLVAPSYAEIDLSIAQQNIWLETDEIGENGTCTQDAGSSGKCKSIFLICDGISGRGKTTAGQIRSGENTFYGTGGIR